MDFAFNVNMATRELSPGQNIGRNDQAVAHRAMPNACLVRWSLLQGKRKEMTTLHSLIASFPVPQSGAFLHV